MQMDFSLPRLEEGKEVTSPPFSPGSLLSRQPPVKTHDHHSFSLYHHNVPCPRRPTISYTLKFMTSSQCRNWFSMPWFPFFFPASEACSDFYFWWQRECDVLGFFALFNYIWCREVRFDGAQRARAAGPVYDNKQWNKRILWSLRSDYRSLFPLQKRCNECLSCLFKVVKAQQGSSFSL